MTYQCDICGKKIDAAGVCDTCGTWAADQVHRVIDDRVYQVPVSEIEAIPEKFQFKLDVDADGVQRPLSGVWDVWAAGVILVYEDRTGRLFVANGHHRLAYARALGVDVMASHLIREIEGYTVSDARRIAAETNIKDNKGTVYDHAEFFRMDKSYSDETVSHRGIKSKGYTIGKSSTDNTYSHFRAKRITPDQAHAIADGAPGDDTYQVAGVKFALDNPRSKPEEIRAFIEALRIVDRAPVQDNLFGFDDAALVDAEHMGREVRRIRAEINDKITAVRSAAKRPDTARKLGVDVRDPGGILKLVDGLKAELARWEKWFTDPELTTHVRGRVRMRAAVA
ncbi:MAG: hypothetical protein JW885_02530 [Deltaproteobacteria bacterium]|nr:hypothetical protein [Candidatus Zymogenaceae bacterium]